MPDLEEFALFLMRLISHPCSESESVSCSVMLRVSREPMDCGPPGSSVHGILQARMLEWVAIHLICG